MLLTGYSAIWLCLTTTVAGEETLEIVVDKLAHFVTAFTPDKLAPISIEDVDTNFNYSRRISVHFKATNITLYNIDQFNLKQFRIGFFPPSIKKFNIFWDNLILKSLYSANGVIYGDSKEPVEANGNATIVLKSVGLDFSATLDKNKLPKIQIQDIYLLDIFVFHSNVKLTNLLDDKAKEKSFNKYLSEAIPHAISDDSFINTLKKLLLDLINKRLS